MPEDTAYLRQEVVRLLKLAGTETNSTMRDAFIRLAIYNYELAYRVEKQGRTESKQRS